MKRYKFFLLALSALLLAGCSLARAEADAAGQDRWVGLYVVPSQDWESFYDNPYLEEYGTAAAETDRFGALSFPQDVLFAGKDGAGSYVFPGLEGGYSLFYVKTHDEHGSVTELVSNMAPLDGGLSINSRDEGESFVLSGAVCYGPPPGARDWDAYTDGNIIWRCYRVYQTEEGRVYLNGDGDSTTGPMTYTLTETSARTMDGGTVREDSLQVTVAIRTIQRLERLTVTQFDENNAIVRSEDLSLQNDRPEVHCQAEAAWVLVEEAGTEGTERTVYSVPEGEDPVSHDYVLLDEAGFGSTACLNIYAYPQTDYAM